MQQEYSKLTLRQRASTWFFKNRNDVLTLGFLLTLGLFSHGVNMLNFPYYENDEATYAARGWALASDGQLDPYTYRYDHAPFGWMVIATWQLLTGGAEIFGSFFASGRVLMLVSFLALVAVVYFLGRKFTNSRLALAASMAIFILSPLSIYFQRRLLLDNIMVLLLMSSMLLALDSKKRLTAYQASGLVFGLAVLTKLTAIFALPAIAYLVYLKARKNARTHILVQWFGVVSIVIGLFIMFALLKGEFLPAKLDSAGQPKNVSLITTMTEQLGRGQALAPWNPNSWFYVNLVDWAKRDAFLIIVGIAGLIASLFAGLKNRLQLAVFLYCIGFILFFMRGKLVINHYIIPLLPGLALASAILFDRLFCRVSALKLNHYFKQGVVLGLVAGLLIIASFNGTLKSYRANENHNLLSAQAWISQNVDKKAVLIIDNYAYPALRYEHGFQKAYYMFPAEYDPAVKKQYGGDWRNINYILVTHEIYKQMHDGTLPTIKSAFENSRAVAIFREGSTSYIDDKNLISTNGDWAAIFEVVVPEPDQTAGPAVNQKQPLSEVN